MRYDATKGITVLAVDDDEVVLKLISSIVGKKLPWKVLTAKTAAKGLEILRKNPIHLVLLDINMPNVDGFKTLDLIQHYEEFKGVPVIFVTSQTDAKTVVRARTAQISDYIRKPIMPDEILERVFTFITETVKFKILVVDDDEISLKLTKRIIEASFPYQTEVIAVNAAPAGLHVLDTEEINLMILDNEMPVINGIRMMEIMRDKEQLGKFPIVFMPGEELDFADRHKIAEFGIKQFLEKPVQPDVLIQTLIEALNVQLPPKSWK